MARTVGSAAEETRRRILDVARRLFVERGYAGTSVQDIAEQVHMTKGSLYYHFSSKEELLHALMTPPLGEHDAFVADLNAAGTMTTDLLARLVDIFDEHAALLRSLFGDPSVARELLRLRLPERMLTLQRAIGGGTDQAAVLRGRCVVGVIHAGVLTTVQTGTPAERCAGTSRTSFDQRRRLTAEEKSFVIAAARAVLGVPASTTHATTASPSPSRRAG